MTDLARGAKWGTCGASGEGCSCGCLSAARVSMLSRCASAREPSPPAEARRNARRLIEYDESIHIKKRVARQQHLTQVRPGPLSGLGLTAVDCLLFSQKLLRGGEFVASWRTAVGQFKGEAKRMSG